MAIKLDKLDKVADLKRALKKGVVIELTASNKPHKFLNIRRLVVESNSVGVGLQPLDSGAVSYLDWPKAAEYSTSGENSFKLTYADGLTLEYLIHATN